MGQGQTRRCSSKVDDFCPHRQSPKAIGAEYVGPNHHWVSIGKILAVTPMSPGRPAAPRPIADCQSNCHLPPV